MKHLNPFAFPLALALALALAAPAVLALALLAAPFTAHAAVVPGAAACPAAHEQLPELLASSMQRIAREAELRAEFEVDAGGRVRPISVTGAPRYHSPVRLALSSLECHGGAPQRYVVNIRFSGWVPGAGGTVPLSESDRSTK